MGSGPKCPRRPHYTLLFTAYFLYEEAMPVRLYDNLVQRTIFKKITLAWHDFTGNFYLI